MYNRPGYKSRAKKKRLCNECFECFLLKRPGRPGIQPPEPPHSLSLSLVQFYNLSLQGYKNVKKEVDKEISTLDARSTIVTRV